MNTEICLAISRDLFFVDLLFGSIDPLFSYKSLPLRPYKISEITTCNLGYLDVITNNCYTYLCCFVAIRSCRGTVVSSKVILQNSVNYDIYNPPVPTPALSGP